MFRNFFKFAKLGSFSLIYEGFQDRRVPAGLIVGFGFDGFESFEENSGSGITGLLKTAVNPSGFRVRVNPIHH